MYLDNKIQNMRKAMSMTLLPLKGWDKNIKLIHEGIFVGCIISNNR